MNVKLDRYNSIFVREISYILKDEIKDNNINFVTITACDITNDLSLARIYFTVLEESKKVETLNALNKASSFIRGKLSERVEIRHTPELNFIYDNSIAYGQRIENIIEEIRERDNN